MSLRCYGAACAAVVGGSVIAFKLYVKLTTGIYKGKERLDGKIVIVTGANAGIGYESAKDFASRGAKVIMVCRDMVKAEKRKSEIISETGNNQIKLKQIDFLSLESVRKCANEILSEEPNIHILLNNAGAAGIGFKQTSDGLEALMQSNYFGPFLFTNILLGKIKDSSPSRIVNVSALAHKISTLDLNHLKKSNAKSEVLLYCDTKLANILFSNELALKLEGTGVTSNSLHPGVFASEFGRNASFLLKIFWSTIVTHLLKSVKEGAQTSIYLCVSPDVQNITGKYFSDCKIASISEKAQDKGLAKKLWELSEEAVNLRPNEKHY